MNEVPGDLPRPRSIRAVEYQPTEKDLLDLD